MDYSLQKQYPSNSTYAGANYLLEGVRLLLHPKLRKYILVPLLVNCALFVVLTSFVLSYFWTVVDSGTSFIPEWLLPWVEPFAWFVWFIVGAFFFIVYAYSFNVITNIVAAPFYGLLAEATEKLLTGKAMPSEPLGRMLMRVFAREISKLLYFMGRGLLVILLMFLVGFIPVVQVIAPMIGLGWAAWSMSIQYVDYTADNHQTPFHTMRNCLWSRIRPSLGFGASIMGCSFIPVLNIFIMPAAVTGGTIFWLNELAAKRSDT